MNGSRRQLWRTLASGSVLVLCGLGARRGQAGAPAACFDLNAMSEADKSLRNSLGFKVQSSDATKCCASCTFFSATSGECGHCALLSGGGVATSSVCDSWAGKE